MNRFNRLVITTMTMTVLAYGQGIASEGTFVLIDYPGAAIVLDGMEIPPGEADTLPVDPGTHRISLYFPAREGQWLPPIVSRPFELRRGERLVVSEESIRYLSITSTPSGADIYLDERFSGVTPLSITLLPTDRSIRLRLNHYDESIVPLDSIGDRSSTLNRLLIPSEPTRDEIVPGLMTRQSARPWPDWIPYATLSYFITSTALGFYNKGLADDRYEEYLGTSSRQEMNRLFDRAESFDNRARIFWVTGQVALATTIYLLIRNYRIRSVERPIPSLGIGMTEDRGGTVYLSIPFGKEVGSER